MSINFAAINTMFTQAMSTLSIEMERRQNQVQAMSRDPEIRAIAFRAIASCTAAGVAVGTATIFAFATWFVVLPVATFLIKVAVVALCAYFIYKNTVNVYQAVSERVLNRLDPQSEQLRRIAADLAARRGVDSSNLGDGSVPGVEAPVGGAPVLNVAPDPFPAATDDSERVV